MSYKFTGYKVWKLSDFVKNQTGIARVKRRLISLSANAKEHPGQFRVKYNDKEIGYFPIK